MRKTLLAAAALLMTTSASFAQSTFGIKAGPSIANFSGQGSNGYSNSGLGYSFKGDNKTIVGYSVGLTYNTGINRLFSFNPELLLLQTGGQFVSSGSLLGVSGSTTVTTRLNYLQIPALFRLNLGGEKFNLYAVFGPYASYAFGGNVKREGDDGYGKRDLRFGDGDNDDNLHRFDFGVAMGIGFGVAVGKGQLGLDFRYQQGLLSLQKDTPDDVDGTDRDESKDLTYNRVFTPSVFYIIPFGNRD